MTVADSNTTGLTPEHQEFLRSQAVDIDLALSLGVRSLVTRADNPQGGVWENWANHPAILFPWANEEGRTEYQVRPDNPTDDSRGRPRKYVFHKGMRPILWAVRPVENASKILIVEGTKQCLAAASYAPDDIGVYGISGCRSWQIDGAPIPDLMAADGREVVVILDADASTNQQVYQAGVELGDALAMEGATKVVFARLPGGADKSGLDDVLGQRPEDRRASWLARIIDKAKPRPADVKPKGRGGSGPPSGKNGRPTVVCNTDRWEVINNLTGALLERWNARDLFCHGGVLSRMRGRVMRPVDKGTFNDVVQSTVVTVNEASTASGGTTHSFAWPDPGTMAACLSRADDFAELDRIAHAPFVREDGSIVTEPGYDKVTRTMLVPDQVFDGLKVPEDPSPEEVRAAVDLIMTEWLGDFPFDAEPDRANVLALVVTPAIRGLVPKVPLAVVDGLQMGVGKNLLADSVLTVYTGEAARPMNWVEETDEVRKQITSAFRTGQEFFVFDEAHTVQGAPLAQALTASTWQDRILGVSTMAEFPNRVTWISLGNQVQVKGDLTRRVYRIALRPRYANPQDRDASTFRHPGQSGLDLLSWTRQHRAELMTAILTVVRHWFAAGQPYPKRGVSFGSFETWERIVGGILEAAGVPGFLGNLKVWRSESDFDGQYWTNHLQWLREIFGTESFKTGQVKAKAMDDPAGFMAPPRLDDPTDKTFGKALGEAYSRMRERRMGGLWLERVSSSHGHVSSWAVHSDEDLPPAPGTEPDLTPEPAPENEHAEARGPAPEDTDGEGHDEVRGADWKPDTSVSTQREDAEMDGPQSVDKAVDTALPAETTPAKTDINVVTFDLETGDAADLYRADPDTYVRIGATAADDGGITAYDEATAWNVARDVNSARIHSATVTGHNIMAFDLPALVRARQLDMIDMHEMAAQGELFDALLVARFLDPPMARDKGVDATRKYDLGTLAETYGLGEKLTEVSKPLAKKYGGWGEIPIDVNDPDPQRAADALDFRTYMVKDVELSRKLYAVLLDKLGGTVPEYLVREHRVAALAAQISHNGFLVDQPLLAERVAEVNRRKSQALDWLAAEHGIPLTDAKGKAYKSPLASALGRDALEAALTAAGATSLWRTATSKVLDTSGDHMIHLAREYHHLPEVREICKAVYRIVGARSVYQTAQDHLCPDGRVHPKIGFEQATGRWSVTSPGLTVFGKRNGRHVERAVFLPDPGEVLISVDLSQVDMRAVAGLSQDRAYIEMLGHDDPHLEIAIALFGDAKRREDAKAIGHGWNYGRGIKAISEGQEIDPALVRRFDTSMRERFPRLVEWQGEVRAQAEAGHLLDNGFGRLMRADPQRAHTQGPALMGQGAARDIMMTGLLRLDARILPMLRAQIHDEVVLSVPAGEAEEVGRAVIEAMTFTWRDVPIEADVSRSGIDWSQCYAKD